MGFLCVQNQPTRKLQAGSVIGNNYISEIMEIGEHCWWTVVSPSLGEKWREINPVGYQEELVRIKDLLCEKDFSISVKKCLSNLTSCPVITVKYFVM